MIVPIFFLDKTVDLSCYVIDINNFVEETGEDSLKIELATKRGRYEKTPPLEVEKLVLLEEDEVLK